MLSQTEIRVLYEISLSIQPKASLEETANFALNTLLRKLTCTSGAIIETQHLEETISYNTIEAVPKERDHSQTIQTVKQILPETPEEFDSELPIIESTDKNSHYYIMELPDVGVLALYKKGSPLREHLIEELQPINRNIANACNQSLIEELERQNNRLERFASIVSHDLRNPLSVAEGRTEILAHEVESPHIEHIQDAHDRMYSLIDNLLTLAKEGESLNGTEQINLRDIIEECCGSFGCGQASLTLESNGDVLADKQRLVQVFENLMRNAKEHGGDSVSVTVGMLEGSDGFYFEDDGPGIPEEDRDHIFDYGFSTTNKGTGFGLAIVKEIVSAHGWDIEFSEGDTGGARFEITNVKTP